MRHVLMPSGTNRRRGRRYAVLATLLGLGTSAVVVQNGTSAQADAAATACQAMRTPINQVTNPTSMTTLLTPWDNEARAARSKHGYTMSFGKPFRASLKADAGLVPVSRLYRAKTGDFLFTSSSSKISAAKAQGYAVEQVEFYASPTAQSCTVPVHRMVKNGIHRPVMKSSVSAKVREGWKDEGVDFYLATSTQDSGPPPSTPTPPPVTPTPPPAGPQNAADADGIFSLAVYPDTQTEVTNPSDRRLDDRNRYVLEQRKAKDIRYVLHSGDMVNWDTAHEGAPNDHRQYDNASRAMKVLESAGLKWAGAIGNHDTWAVGPTGGDKRPGVNVKTAVRDTKTYNKYFGTRHFSDVAGTFESGKIDNSYRVFSAVGKKWLVLSLELWPRAEAVNWAKKVVTSNKDKNVILVTHAYLGGGGDISGYNGGYGATSPKYVFDQVIKPNANVKVVVSGHIGTYTQRQDTTDKGTKVVSYLQCFHSGNDNPVRFVEIDVKKGTATTSVYGPKQKKTYLSKQVYSGMSFV